MQVVTRWSRALEGDEGVARNEGDVYLQLMQLKESRLP